MSEFTHPMSTGFGDGRYTALLLAREAIGSGSVSPLLMAVTGEYLTGHDIPHIYLTHEPLRDKRAYLESVRDEIATIMGTALSPRALITVTLTFATTVGPCRFLLGGVGRRIDNKVKAYVATDAANQLGIDITNKQIKGAVINPADGWNPSVGIGLEPGIIGPLLEEVPDRSVLGYFMLAEDAAEVAPETPVEIALSQTESLILPYEALAPLLSCAQAAFVPRPSEPPFFRGVVPYSIDPVAASAMRPS